MGYGPKLIVHGVFSRIHACRFIVITTLGLLMQLLGGRLRDIGAYITESAYARSELRSKFR